MIRTQPQHAAGRPTGRLGFSIIELLVVISIMAILLTALAPVAFNLDEGARLAAAVNTVDAAAQAARAYATREQASRLDIPFSSHSGAALVFTGQGEIRLTANTQDARDTAGNLLEALRKNGFEDIPGRDYAQLPKGVGVAGIVVGGLNAGQPRPDTPVIPPPFALRFDDQGRMSVLKDARLPGRLLEEYRVHYDGNYDGRYDVTKILGDGTGLNFLPTEWDEENISKSDTSKWHSDSGRYKLPIEVLEPVAAVIVYSKSKFKDDGGVWPSSGSPNGVSPARGCGPTGNDSCTATTTGMSGDTRHLAIRGIMHWLLEIDPETGRPRNAVHILFNPSTGNIIKE